VDVPPAPAFLRVLAYHAICALPVTSPLRRYGVPPADFSAQLDLLLRANYSFIDGDSLLGFLEGRTTLPARAVLLTFDDCHESVEHAAEIIHSRGIPAVAFAISGSLAASAQDFGAIGPLLNSSGLLRLVTQGVEIGAHSHTHPWLTTLNRADLSAETTGAIARLRSAGVGAVRWYAYPYGAHNERVRDFVRQAGVSAAFTVDPGFARREDDWFGLSRILIEYGETGLAFRAKVETGGGLSRVRARLRVRSRLCQLYRRRVPRLPL
jgi:peptidoglycan/xylan/chitin deacetylase (PgdA/CDA1 family)